jgi:cyclase
VPLIACGGAGKLSDFEDALNVGKASAVAAGSFFVYHGKKHAVLINFPTRTEIDDILVKKALA